MLNYKGHRICLVDDGTLDTVIAVDGEQIRFDCEYASQFRVEDGALTMEGFKELSDVAIETAEENSILQGEK